MRNMGWQNCKMARWLGIKIFLSIYLFVCLSVCLYGYISTTFADLILENLEIGESYNLRTLRNCPMVIKNRTNETVEVKIEVVVPEKALPGYEPIPDVSWIQILPNRYRLGPYQSGSSDVIITIPKDEKLVGKHFQANINNSSFLLGLPPAQLVISPGISSRFRFSIGSMGPETIKAEKKRRKMMTLDYELDPVNITIKNPVEIGRKIDLRKEGGARLTLINRSTEPVPLIMTAINTNKEGEYEPGDPKFLEIKPKKIKLKGESMEKLDLYLNIPDKEQYRNKKYLFLIQAQVPADVPVEVFSKLFITTEK